MQQGQHLVVHAAAHHIGHDVHSILCCKALTQDELAECIADAKAQIIDCNLLLKNAAQDEEDDL